MIKKAVIIPLLLGAKVAMASGLQLNCWDGSFFYKTLNITQTDLGYEVSLKGSSLATVPPRDHSDWSPKSVHALFPVEACEVSQSEIRCALPEADPVYVRVYVEKEGEEGFQDYPVDALEFMASDTIAMKLGGTIPVLSEQTDPELGFTPWTCNTEGSTRTGGTEWGAARFSEGLRSYIRDLMDEG